MRFYRGLLLGAALVGIAGWGYLFLLSAGPYLESNEPYGRLQFEKAAASKLSLEEFRARIAVASDRVERGLGKVGSKLTIVVVDQLTQEGLTRDGRTERIPLPAQISWKWGGADQRFVFVSAERADADFLTVILTRIRLLELADASEVIMYGPEGTIENGLGFYLSEPNGERMSAILEHSLREGAEPGEETTRGMTRSRVLGWLICAYLHKVKGWTLDQIGLAKEAELGKVVPNDARLVWNEVRAALGKSK